jgi:Translation initiation factor 2, beta subunit (eIF-2beta)/eIF-5 N-terminal domain
MKKSLSISSYEKMLDRLYSMVQVKVDKFRRFEQPVAEVINVKNRTIITNFKEIAEKLNRDLEDLASFFFKDLAISGMIEPNTKQLILFGKFTFERINMSLKYYIKKYLLCPVCNSNDTIIVREKKNIFLKCLACGATSSVVE